MLLWFWIIDPISEEYYLHFVQHLWKYINIQAVNINANLLGHWLGINTGYRIFNGCDAHWRQIEKIDILKNVICF